MVLLLVCYVHGSGDLNAYEKPNIPALLDFVARRDCIGVASTFPRGFQLFVPMREQESLALEPFLLGTCGMLPEERATYDAAIATIKKIKLREKQIL